MKKNKTKYTESNDDDYFQYIEVEYKLNNIFEEHYESNTYIQEIKGDVFLIDDSNGSKEKVGEIFLYLLDMKGNYTEGFDYEDMLDGHSMEFTNYVNDFFDLDEGFIKPQFSNDDLFDNPDILIIHTVILNENARNKGYGLRVMKNIEFVFGKDKLIILRPCPIQFGGTINNTVEVKEFNLDLLPKNINMINTYAKKIANNYAKIGYKKDKKSDLMFKANQEIL
jgi:hypothetical protein